MIYEYRCNACEHIFDRTLKMDDRKIPETEPCPECGQNEVKQKLSTSGFVTQSIGTLRKAGTEWQDVLKGIKKASGKDNSINV